MNLRRPARGFPARFQGWCDNCDHRIETDELITDVGNRTFVHVECPDTLPEKPTRFVGSTDQEMGF